MADLPIALTCADYARLAPLMIGDVKPEGVDLTLIHGAGGSWTGRAEMLRRAARYRARKCGAAKPRWRRTCAASTRATAALSGCRCFRCATSPPAISTS